MDLELLGSMVGKKYVENGRGPDEYDCYGLVLRLGELYGVELPELSYTMDYVDRDTVANANRSQFIRVELPEFGDIIALRVGKFVTHVGWMVDRTRFIHTTKATGAVITRVDSIKYINRIEGYYRWIRR